MDFVKSRTDIFALLKNTVVFKIVQNAKNVEGLEFEHLDYMVEKIFKDVDVGELEKVFKQVYDLETHKITNPEKVTKFFEFITPAYLTEKLKDYDSAGYLTEKIQKGAELSGN